MSNLIATVPTNRGGRPKKYRSDEERKAARRIANRDRMRRKRVGWKADSGAKYVDRRVNPALTLDAIEVTHLAAFLVAGFDPAIAAAAAAELARYDREMKTAEDAWIHNHALTKTGDLDALPSGVVLTRPDRRRNAPQHPEC